MIVTTSLSFSFPNVPLCMKLEETGEKGLFFFLFHLAMFCVQTKGKSHTE